MMKITPIADIKTETLPPIYRGEKIAHAVLEDGTQLSVYCGMQRKYVDELKALSRDMSDEALQKGTTDYKRFGLGDYEKWYQKRRTPYVLVDDATDTLASIVWYGPKSLPQVKLTEELSHIDATAWDSCGFRTYGDFRGKGVTTVFSGYIIDLYTRQNPHRHMWLGVQKDNEPGVRLYTRLGFKTIGEDEIENEFIMKLTA